MRTALEIATGGYFKVKQSRGSLVTATFYNPETCDEISEAMRDYDYSDCSRDNDDLYYMKVDERVSRLWRHRNGEILVNDIARVAKGHKLPIGKTGRVKEIKPIYNKYHRFVCSYIYFEDGSRTDYANCVLEQASEI